MTEEKDQPIQKLILKNIICPHHGLVLHTKKEGIYKCLICEVALEIREKQRIIEGEEDESLCIDNQKMLLLWKRKE